MVEETHYSIRMMSPIPIIYSELYRKYFHLIQTNHVQPHPLHSFCMYSYSAVLQVQVASVLAAHYLNGCY